MAKDEPTGSERGLGSAAGLCSASLEGSRSTGTIPEEPSLAAHEAGRSVGDLCQRAAHSHMAQEYSPEISAPRAIALV